MLTVDGRDPTLETGPMTVELISDEVSGRSVLNKTIKIYIKPKLTIGD